MKRLLVAVDFSNATDYVIEQAKKLAKSAEGKIMLVHVAAPEPDFIGNEVGPQAIRDQKAEVLRDEHKKIQTIAEDISNEGISVTPLLIQGVTVDEILNESKKFRAELIIIGSHGHGAMYNLLMGSTVEGVIKKSTIPVLVVPVNSK